MIGERFPGVLRDARSGDHSALTKLYQDTAPLVLGYARSRGAVEPEDVASEVYVAMVRSIARFDGDETQFRSWLLTIAHHKIADSLRRYGRRPEEPAPVDEWGERLLLLTDSESEAMQRLRSRGILEAIDELTDDQRAVLMLRVLADLTVPQIADVVGKPETAVKALLRRGTANLQRRLRAEAIAESEDDR